MISPSTHARYPGSQRRAAALSSLRLAMLVLLVAGATACRTVDYRAVQADFNHAVAIDNGITVSGDPFTDPGYAEIAAYLSDEKIEKLDTRLRPNAWLIRAFSEVRSGQLDPSTGAMRSQARGLTAGAAAGSRDDVLLRLLPALVIEREIEIKWVEKGRQVSPEEYDAMRSDFETALGEVQNAFDAVVEATPGSVEPYLHYQKWRILTNWRSVILSIRSTDGTDDEKRGAALGAAKTFLSGSSLRSVRDLERDAIPDSHPLRALIRTKENS